MQNVIRYGKQLSTVGIPRILIFDSYCAMVFVHSILSILPSHIFVGDTDTSVVVDDLLVLVGLLVIH